jgi:hydrogenase expression/formation protein HypC
MCLGVPARVVAVLPDDLATADVGGVRRDVSIALVDGCVRPGDWLLLHVGFALGRIDEAEAAATLALIEEIEL